MGNVQSAYLSYSHHQDQQRKKRAQKLANSWQGKRMMKSGRMKRYMAKREKELGQGADLRRAEEEDTTMGERVWFSRCILNGRLQHWVLITHGMKYELRRRDHLQKNGGTDSQQQQQQTEDEQQGDFVCNIKQYTIDQERRDLSLTKLLVPDVDGYYVCLIGWTHLTKEQVDAACHEVLTQFGKYSLLRNNCQDFLRQVAALILTERKAADYPWFMSNTKTKYQKDQWLKPPPEEMMMRMLNSMAANQMAMQNQMQIQNQMQNQMQNQIQMQIQMQIQNQIQMQMQTQMQTQMMANTGGAGA